MPLTLEQAIARVPMWKGASDLKAIPLGGGITNKNYRIDTNGESFVLRITGENTEQLGIDRQQEYAANKAAADLGIAPEVIYFIQPEGYLVTRFVEGVQIPPAEMVKPENLGRAAKKIRKFHTQAPLLKSEFNVFRRVEMLTEISRQSHCRFPNNFDWMMQRMREVEQAFRQDPMVLRPCHDDLLNLNFLDEHGELRILDWEYAGMGDVFFDLANFSHHHRLNDDQVRRLLQAYFGNVTRNSFARLRLMWAISELHEATWATTQTGISQLDEDFQGYADLWFGRAMETMKDERWEQWLEEFSDS